MKLSRRNWVLSCMALAVARSSRAADIQSGVQVGDFAGPFDVKDITGPNKGRELCYR